MIAPTLIGTEKQVKWANDIRHTYQQRYPDASLPEHSSAKFWIDNQNLSLDELHRMAATQVYSPCTKTYPQYMRADIEPLLRNMNNFAVFDTETSGLPKHKKAEIVELSIVAVKTGEVLFNSLFHPHDIDYYLQSEARQMHAFTEEAYTNAPTFPEKWEEIRRILDRYHLIAYNADFDANMLIRTAHLWGLSVPRLKITCAMETFQAFMTTESMGRANYKLSVACELLDINQETFGTPHTALADALATRELLLRMRQSLDDEQFERSLTIEEEVPA